MKKNTIVFPAILVLSLFIGTTARAVGIDRDILVDAGMLPEEETEAVRNAEDVYLTLVNKTHQLPEDWLHTIQLAETVNYAGETYELEQETLTHYEALKAKMQEEGISIDLESAYRSVEKQQALWDEYEALYGEEYCKQYVAVPGYSEHHTGLALDICLIQNGAVVDSSDPIINDLFAAVHAHLAECGFILRYPAGKEDITGYSYEAWHIRYVGEENAQAITSQWLTLEEYLGQV